MGDEFLGDRRVALEEAFFAKENEKLRLRLKALDEARQKKQALSAASGITDDVVLEKLAALDISSDTVAALSLLPLIAVAWADGSIDEKERRAVLSRATELGLKKQDISHRLFEDWLAHQPPQALIAAWKGYIAAFSARLEPDARRALRHDLLARARAVAEAAGSNTQLS